MPGTPIVIPPQAQAEFDRAVQLLRDGRSAEAETAFQRLAGSYLQLAAPAINLGIIHRKAGRLEQSEQALREAVERNDGSAVAWTELGVTLRMRGQFEEAARAYEQAIAADPDFAPAYRNLGVLLDLYMGNPDGALDNLERYQQLTGEDKPITGWIAELRQRTGRRAPPPPSAEPPAAEEGDPPAGGASAAEGAPNEEPLPDGAAPGGTPPQGAEEGDPPADGGTNQVPQEPQSEDAPPEEGTGGES